MPDRPRVSVIVPIHDQARVVGETIASVRAQTLDAWELVVVDDGSSDDGAERARRTADPRVRVLAQENAGVMAARRRGFEATTGDAVVFLDGDDRLRPDALARFAAGLARHPEAGAVYGDRVLIDAAGRVFGSEHGALLNPRPSGDILERLLVRPFLSTPGQICVRRAALARVERWPLHVRRAADWVLLGQVAAIAPFVYLGHGPVVEYRMAPGSMARSLARTDDGGVHVDEMEPALDALFDAPAVVRRLGDARRAALRRRAKASAFAWKGQELLRAREWSRARAYFREALALGSRDPRDVLCLALTVVRTFPPGTRRWIGVP